MQPGQQRRTRLPRINKTGPLGRGEVKPVGFDPDLLKNLSIVPEAKPQARAATTTNQGATPNLIGAPSQEPLFGALQQAQDLLSSGEASTVDPYSAPLTQAFPAQSDVLERVRPIPVKTYDWRARADAWTGRLFAAEPGDDLAAITKKMDARRRFADQLEALDGDLTPGDVDAIALAYHDSLVPPEPAFAEFSPESRAALERAYQSSVPGARVATARDIDPNKAAAIAAFGLAGMLSGKGNFTDALRGASALFADAQSRVDLGQQKAMADDEARRAKALEEYKRLVAIDTFNAGQKGYQAKGDRDLKRQMLTQGMIGDRQDAAADAKQYAADRNAVMQAVASGDPGRAAMLVDMFELAYPDQPLPENVRRLSPTINQKLTLSKIDESKATIERVTAMADGIRFKNALDRKTFDDQVKFIKEKGRLEDLKADKLEEEIKFLPKANQAKLANWWVDRRYKLAMINIRAQEAQARLVAAQKAGSKDTSDKDYVGTLKSLVTGFNTSIDNKSREYARVEGEIATLENLKLNQQAVNESADVSVIEGQIRAKRKQMQDLETDLDGEQKKVNEYLNLIDKTLKGGK